MSDPMNDDKHTIDQLYQSTAEGPPKHLDQAILQHAKAQQRPQPRQLRSWRPWLAAASVVLVLPFIWMLTLQPELTQSNQLDASPQTPPTEVIDVQLDAETSQRARRVPSKPKVAQPDLNAIREEMAPAAEMELMAPAVMAPEPSIPADFVESMEADLSGSATKDDMALQETEESAIVVTGSRLKASPLQRNQALLKDEFKAAKKSLKPSNLTPTLALELEQFEALLEQGEWRQAEELLNTMQTRDPDFDYGELVERLAALRAD